jgi:hypothetical protein
MNNDFLEILKYTVPSLIVFASIYVIFKNFLNQQFQMEALKHRQSQGKDIIPLKLQAYERLMLLCERISIDNLSYRLVNSEMGVKELKNSMLIAIQQEYEHNITQQVYLSENLWKIIQLTKDQMQFFISNADGSTPAEFIVQIKKNMADSNADPVSIAKRAIKNDADVLL